MNNHRRRILCALAAIPVGYVALRATIPDSFSSTSVIPSLPHSNFDTTPDGVVPAVDILADLPHKPEYTVNSWFAVGHFESRGHTLNYLVHVFAISINGYTVAIDSVASITDETTGWYEVEHNFHTTFRATASAETLRVKTPTTEISGSLGSMVVRAQLKNASIDVRLSAVGLPLYNKGTGRFDLLGMDVYQYSIPTLETSGRLVINGEEFVATGMSWFDRQWQNQPLGAPKGRWTWMDLNLSNGWAVSLWDAQDEDGKTDGWVTILDEHGKQRVANLMPLAKTANDNWLSPVSGYKYPTRWRIFVPELDMQLEVVARPSGQEINGLSPRYEGASVITGTVQGKDVVGHCYVEMVGDWKASTSVEDDN